MNIEKQIGADLLSIFKKKKMNKIIVTTQEELISIVEKSVNNQLSDLTRLIKAKINPPKTNLSVKEVAKKLNVTELTIRNYITRGLIKADRIGRRVLISSIELEKSLSEVKSLRYKR